MCAQSSEARCLGPDCTSVHCEDCDACRLFDEDVYIVAANYGDGAFLAVLCATCDHRRQYRAELKKRLKARRAPPDTSFADMLA